MTKIFKDYAEFLQREDKKVNGVSLDFTQLYKDWEEKNKTNEGCWNCSECYDCYDCSRCSRCYGCSDCSRCYGCSCCYGCSDCSRCSRCYDCSECSDCYVCYVCYGCYDCSRCSRCYGCSECYDEDETKGGESAFTIPIIPNIHTLVHDAVTKPKALDMSTWHTCDTTHCRAGWVVFLAGEAGEELEEKTSTAFAAMQIYHKSCPEIPVSPTRFYEDNKTAMADIIRCAEEEKAKNNI